MLNGCSGQRSMGSAGGQGGLGEASQIRPGRVVWGINGTIAPLCMLAESIPFAAALICPDLGPAWGIILSYFTPAPASTHTFVGRPAATKEELMKHFQL